MPVKVFFCYAREDEPLTKKLKIQLASRQRQGLIEMWHDRDINAGTEWEQEISEHLNAAQLILLLVSPDFMNSDYCYSVEMKRALERHRRKQAYVIPLILRPVHWEDVLGNIQALPTDGKPVTSWQNPDEAFFNIADGIRTLVKEIAKQSTPQASDQSKQALVKPTIQQGRQIQDQSSGLQTLKNQFNEAMVNLYKGTAKIGYRASQFIHMVNENGGVETAHLLLAKEPTEGFTRLWEKKRLDLSVEALVLKPQFVSLFGEKEREHARKRLAEYGYIAQRDSQK